MSLETQNEKAFGKTIEKVRSVVDHVTVQAAQLQAPLREIYEEIDSIQIEVEAKRKELEDLYEKDTVLMELQSLKGLVDEAEKELQRKKEEVYYSVEKYKRDAMAEAEKADLERQREVDQLDFELQRRVREVEAREEAVSNYEAKADASANRKHAAIFAAKEAAMKLDHEGQRVRTELMEAQLKALETENSKLRDQVSSLAEKSLEAQSGQAALVAAQNMAGTIGSKK